MKKQILLILSLALFTAMTQAQGFSKFFEKYADDERFSYAKFAAMQTLSTDITATNRAFMESLEKEVLDILKKENYLLNVESREKGERTYIYNHPNGETVIMSKDRKEWNVVWTLSPKSRKKQPKRSTETTPYFNDSLKDYFGELQKTFRDSAFLKQWKDLGKIEIPQQWKDMRTPDQWKDMKIPDEWKSNKNYQDFADKHKDLLKNRKNQNEPKDSIK